MRITATDNLLKACEMGIEAEVANIAMYDRLNEATVLPDVVTVLQRAQTLPGIHYFLLSARLGI